MDFVIRPGNIDRGGSTRARGESEFPNKKLSPDEIETSTINRELGAKEIKFLEDFLKKEGIRAKEALTDSGMRRYVENTFLKQKFPYTRFESHLKVLIAQGK